MSRVEEVERLVAQLTPAEFADFRRWFVEFDAERWDRQFATDVADGKLDDLAERALAAHLSGQTSKL